VRYRNETVFHDRSAAVVATYRAEDRGSLVRVTFEHLLGKERRVGDRSFVRIERRMTRGRRPNDRADIERDVIAARSYVSEHDPAWSDEIRNDGARSGRQNHHAKKYELSSFFFDQ
jgi:hypothetical protein